jgi:hypothetical protein
VEKKEEMVGGHEVDEAEDMEDLIEFDEEGTVMDKEIVVSEGSTLINGPSVTIENTQVVIDKEEVEDLLDLEVSPHTTQGLGQANAVVVSELETLTLMD